LTVTDPSNGCTSTASVTVIGDVTPPAVNTVGGDITCLQDTVTIDGSTSAGAPGWTWSGPGITPANETLEDPEVIVDGTYTVVVVDSINGCTNTATAIVNLDTDIPTVSAGPDQTLTCLLTSTPLQGSGNTGMAPMDVLWTGPNNFSDTILNPTVNVGGQYILTITNEQNGCLLSDTVDIAVDQVLPVATAGGFV
jgi:hypothetical protein